jgi:hypothetical protein
MIDMNKIYDKLSKDLSEVIDMSNAKVQEYRQHSESKFLEEQETWFRLANRIAITTIESTLFKLKQIILIVFEAKNIELSEEDTEKLMERKANGQPRYMRTKENIIFTFDMLAHATELDFKVKFDKGWSNLLSVIRKRNNLTHPKSSEDLRMSVSEHQKTELAFEWFQKTMKDFNNTLKDSNKFGFKKLRVIR